MELVSAQAGRTAKEIPRAVGSFNVFVVAHVAGATRRRSFAVTAPLRELPGRGGVAERIVPDAQAAGGAEIGRAARLLQ